MADRPTHVSSAVGIHIKLGVMKNFVKALPKDSAEFIHLRSVFPHISLAKIHEGNKTGFISFHRDETGLLIGPDIRKLMKDETFADLL